MLFHEDHKIIAIAKETKTMWFNSYFLQAYIFLIKSAIRAQNIV